MFDARRVSPRSDRLGSPVVCSIDRLVPYPVADLRLSGSGRAAVSVSAGCFHKAAASSQGVDKLVESAACPWSTRAAAHPGHGERRERDKLWTATQIWLPRGNAWS